MKLHEIKQRNKLNLGVTDYFSLAFIQEMIDEGYTFTPEQLAAVSGAVFAERYISRDVESITEFNWTPFQVQDAKVQCERFGHTCYAHSCVESGFESVTCLLCNFEFSCYH